MPSPTYSPQTDPCILQGVQPLLAELHTHINLQVVDPAHPDHRAAQAFIHQVFERRYGADVRAFYPHLLSFHDAQRRRAVVGLRNGGSERFFAEQYLPYSAQQLISERLDVTAQREEVVEVGNLALESAGDARWIIAASIMFLHALGYRWVLFTATRSLINTFHRLGLQPIGLVAAKPDQLDEGSGRHWGDYYQTGPVVCAGQLESGYRKLRRHVDTNQPVLRALLCEMARQAALFGGAESSRCGGE